MLPLARVIALSLFVISAGSLGVVMVVAPSPSPSPSPSPTPSPDLSAFTGRTIVVAQDGSGDAVTIAEAVAAASDNDRILVRPGTYRESVSTDKTIALVGDGDPDAVIWEAPIDGPDSSTLDWQSAAFVPGADQGYALELRGTDSLVAGLTFQGLHARLLLDGGAPTVQGVRMRDIDFIYGSGPELLDLGTAILATGRAEAVIRGSVLERAGLIGMINTTSVLVEGNTLTGGSYVWSTSDGGDNHPVIRDNRFEDALVHAVLVHDQATVLIERNHIETDPDALNAYGEAPAGMIVNTGNWGAGWAIRDNVVRVAGTAIEVSGTIPAVEGNDVADSTVGISIVGDALVRDNQVTGNDTGILVAEAGSRPTLEGNTITSNGVGIDLVDGATPTLTGNTLCENGENVRTSTPASPPGLQGNEVCPDAGS